ncbi:transposase domain-containing protein [Nostoc sp. 'Peltigera membranacea cyanobiont' N6]|uniref:transposase domain-containing protein n=1 Tax=Nostoc sp. 'Peltigera membranacea cyanobiont' N6 TaxID=1261031 RepID=UPI0021580689|nr:transposase domain-containing protein [Nostoc sp. 'Peltigera membranacea cyanobiont' N6]
MSFWSSDSVVSVFKNLIHGFASLRIPELIRFKTPTSSSITEARQRTGASVMTRLFEMVAKPLATPLTPGAFLGGLRIMAVDQYLCQFTRVQRQWKRDEYVLKQ